MIKIEIQNTLMTKELKSLFELLDRQVYFVGGAIRDTLTGKGVQDIDLATPLTPENVMEKLKDTSIKIVPTGIKHGTLTLILPDKMKVEITTFRQDVETDGRRAVVCFGNSMEEDAKRRDFTVNALYMRWDGTVFDFVEGLKDIKKKRLRFIGNPNERIKEDALRILRYFRFFAQTGLHKPDLQTLKACRQGRHLLKRLSKERVRDEIFKMLFLPNPYSAFHFMSKAGVLRQIVGSYDLNDFRYLLSCERKAGAYSSPLFRLWILCKRRLPEWHLSNAQLKMEYEFEQAFNLPLKTRADEYRILYLYGKEVFLNTLLYKKRLCFAGFRFYQRLNKPALPFESIDVANFFNVESIDLGKKFKICEDKWLSLGCPNKKEVVFNSILE